MDCAHPLLIALQWYPLDSWIVLIAVLAALSCALLGTFLVLRQMSMMGDAISHAVLPGLAAAFLITGTRASWPMFVGAAIVGVLTALFTQWVHRLGNVDRGASMGVVFTLLFAMGLIMIRQAADTVDLDPDCVLYGDVVSSANVNAYGTEWLGITAPQAVWTLAGVLLVNVVYVALMYKELKITSFDPSLATTLGLRSDLVHYSLMILVAVTTVAAFEVVGSILVIAMLIVPPMTARLFTDRLGVMLGLSLVLGAVMAGLGHVAAIGLPPLVGFRDTVTAGGIAFVAGLMLALGALLAPNRGLLVRGFAQHHRGRTETLPEG